MVIDTLRASVDDPTFTSTDGFARQKRLNALEGFTSLLEDRNTELTGLRNKLVGVHSDLMAKQNARSESRGVGSCAARLQEFHRQEDTEREEREQREMRMLRGAVSLVQCRGRPRRRKIGGSCSVVLCCRLLICLLTF
jgi:hypothetical protein